MTIGVRTRLTRDLRRSLPKDVTMRGGPLLPPARLPFPEEEAAVETASARRRRDYVSGRHYARRAVEAHGLQPCAIPVGDRGSPVWPPGIVGSISHCDAYCVAIVGDATRYLGIGVDVELAEPLGDNVLDLVCVEEEMARRASIESRHGVDLPKLLFVAKESACKAYDSVSQAFPDFTDVTVDISPEGREFRVEVSGRCGDLFPAVVLAGEFVTGKGLLAAWTTATIL